MQASTKQETALMVADQVWGVEKLKEGAGGDRDVACILSPFTADVAVIPCRHAGTQKVGKKQACKKAVVLFRVHWRGSWVMHGGGWQPHTQP